MDVSISFFFCGRSVRCLFDGVDYGVESKRVHRAHRSFFGKRDHHFIAEKHYSMMGKAFGYAHLLQSCWFRATSTCDECLMRVGVLRISRRARRRSSCLCCLPAKQTTFPRLPGIIVMLKIQK